MKGQRRLFKKHSNKTLYCSECGAKAEATCDCGVAYEPAGVAAVKAVTAHPELSDRAIAKKIGIHYSTVREARLKLATGGNPSVDRRIGLDGKSRRLPRHDNAAPHELEHIPAAAELVQKLQPIMDALKQEGKCHAMTISPSRVSRLAHELLTQINKCITTPIAKAKVCELCASDWKIDETQLNEGVIDAVRAVADAWSDLCGKLELIYSAHEEDSADCSSGVTAAAAQEKADA